MQHSELNGSQYCLNLFCSFSQDHAFNISYTRLTTKWQWYFTSTVTYNTNCSTLYHKDCSQSILHSPTVSLIQIIREATNSEYLLNVKNTQQKHINCSSMVITWSAIGSRLSFSATSVTYDSLALKPTITFSPKENVRHDLLQEIPFYRNSRDITMFRKAFQKFLSWIKNI